MSTEGFTYRGYQVRILNSFSVLYDYLWKSPNFLSSEIEVERKKLDAYFPDTGTDEQRVIKRELRQQRAALEGRKLFGEFPIFVAQANLFLATSVFERHLHQLCRVRENACGSELATTRGNGNQRYFDYLQSGGIALKNMHFIDCARATIEIRNAILHADGDLSLSRRATYLRQVIEKRLYMKSERRASGEGMVDDWGRPEIAIVENRLTINHYFAFRAAANFQDLLMELTEAIPEALNAKWSEKVRPT